MTLTLSARGQWSHHVSLFCRRMPLFGAFWLQTDESSGSKVKARSHKYCWSKLSRSGYTRYRFVIKRRSIWPVQVNFFGGTEWGDYSGPVTSESACGTGRARGAHRTTSCSIDGGTQNSANQNIDIEALTSRAQREADERSEAAEVAVLPKGSAFVAAPLSSELEANSGGLIATYDVKRIGGKKNAGFGAAAMIAAVSLFGATGAVSQTRCSRRTRRKRIQAIRR